MNDKARELSGVLFRREDYLDLRWETNSVDTHGNIYVATVFGGRDPGDQRRAICRVSALGTPACFVLARAPELELTPRSDRTDNLAVDADGVVFMRVEQSLVRIDFPEG